MKTTFCVTCLFFHIIFMFHGALWISERCCCLLLLLWPASEKVWKRITEEVSAEWVFQAISQVQCFALDFLMQPWFRYCNLLFLRYGHTSMVQRSIFARHSRYLSMIDENKKSWERYGKKNINLVAVTKEKEERIINYWWYGLLFWSPISRTFFPPIRNYVRSYKLLTAKRRSLRDRESIVGSCKNNISNINNTVLKH